MTDEMKYVDIIKIIYTYIVSKSNGKEHQQESGNFAPYCNNGIFRIGNSRRRACNAE